MMNGNFDLFSVFGVEAPPVKEEKKQQKNTTIKPKTVKNEDDDVDNADSEEEKKKSKTKAPAPKTISPGEIIVKVYGMELMRVNLEEEKEESIILEEIREKLANEYGYAEFSKERTTMTFSKETRIVVPAISFMKKG